MGYSDYVIKCEDSVDDGCGSTLLDSYVSIYDTDPLMADNALRIASTNELTFRVDGEENGILTTPLKVIWYYLINILSDTNASYVLGIWYYFDI